MSSHSLRTAPPITRLLAIARRSAVERLRSRALLGAAAITAINTFVLWDQLARPFGAANLLSLFGFLASIIVGAGLIGDESASGALHIDLLAWPSPSAQVLGAVSGAFVAVAASLIVPAAVCLPALVRSVGYGPTLLVVAATGAAIVGMLSIAALVGSFAPGKANAAAVFAIFLFGGLAETFRPDERLSEGVAIAYRAVALALPSSGTVSTWTRAMLDDRTWPRGETLGVFVAPLIWLALAALALEWRARRGIAEAA
jgi:hypothetical protein